MRYQEYFIIVLLLVISCLTYQNYCFRVQNEHLSNKIKEIKNETIAILEETQRDALQWKKIEKLEEQKKIRHKENNEITEKYKNNKTNSKNSVTIIERKVPSVKDLYPEQKGELHIVGVYEGVYPDGERHSYNYHPQGNVSLSVQITDQPIVLVMCSYEPVKWSVSLNKATKIKKIILGGYYDQEVSGVPDNVPIYKEYFFSYKQNDETYSKMKQKIQEFTDLSISSFQGKYKNDHFVIDAKNRETYQKEEK